MSILKLNSAVGTLMLGCFFATTVWAETPAPTTVSDATIVALQFYERGNLEMAEGRYEAACRSFELSINAKPGIGTYASLGDCYWKIGRSLDARLSFLTSAAMATESAKRRDYALQRAKYVEQQLGRLTIECATGCDEIAILLNGRAVGTYESLVFVVPGKQQITATSRERLPWKKEFSVSLGGAVTVVIPDLQPVGKPTESTSPPTISPDQPLPENTAAPLPSLAATHRGHDTVQPNRYKLMRWSAIGMGSLSAALGAVSLLYAIDASSDYDQITAMCAVSGCNQAQADQANGAVARSNIATGLGVGAGLLAAGAVTMWLLAPKRSTPQTVAPFFVPHGIGVFAGMQF